MYFHFLDGYLNPTIGADLTSFITNFRDKLTNNNTDIIINSKLEDANTIMRRLEENNYLIYQTVQNMHTTSLLFFIKKSKYYIFSFNSGLGINNHETFNKKYLPYYGIIIDNKLNFLNYTNVIINLYNTYKDFKEKPETLLRLDRYNFTDLKLSVGDNRNYYYNIKKYLI